MRQFHCCVNICQLQRLFRERRDEDLRTHYDLESESDHDHVLPPSSWLLIHTLGIFARMQLARVRAHSSLACSKMTFSQQSLIFCWRFPNLTRLLTKPLKKIRPTSARSPSHHRTTP